MKRSKDNIAEIFAIGDELLFGRIYDTNSFWMAEQVTRLGAEVRRITCLPDDKDEIIKGVQEAIGRSAKFIFISGGLGPTPDDVTVEAMADLLGCSIDIDQSLIERYMRWRNISRDQLTPPMIKMASVPASAEILPNPVGWAPGLAMDKEGIKIFVTPGPPKEMKGIFEEHIADRVSSLLGRKSTILRLFIKMHESQMSPLMEEVMKQFPQTYVKAYVSMSTDKGLPVDIISYGITLQDSKDRLTRALEFLTKLVKDQNRDIYLLEEES